MLMKNYALMGDAPMKLYDMKASDRCPHQEPIARALANLAAIQRERHEREKATEPQTTRTRRNRSLPAE